LSREQRWPEDERKACSGIFTYTAHVPFFAGPLSQATRRIAGSVATILHLIIHQGFCPAGTIDFPAYSRVFYPLLLLMDL
jgi:hypothetical protein